MRGAATGTTKDCHQPVSGEDAAFHDLSAGLFMLIIRDRVSPNQIPTFRPLNAVPRGGTRLVIAQPAPPRTSRSVSSDTAGRQSSPTGLASEKQLSNRVAPGRVARCTAAA